MAVGFSVSGTKSGCERQVRADGGDGKGRWREGGKKGETDMRGGWRKSRRTGKEHLAGRGREQGKVTWPSD